MTQEQVLTVAVPVLQQAFVLSRQYWPVQVEELNRLPFTHTLREQAEQDDQQKQLIVYALVFDAQNRLFTYQRHGSEGRLAGRYSAGIGGHVNDQDVGPSLSHRLLASLLGMINEDESEVGRCHIGVVFRADVANVQTATFAAEIARPQWQTMQELDLTGFELWSQLAICLAQGGHLASSVFLE